MAFTPSKVIEGRAAALISTAEGHLKVEGDRSIAGDILPLTSSGLLVHATSCLKSIIFRLGPDGALNDASRLLRSLYDHVVTFAWIASDPAAHLPAWRKADLQERLTMDREAHAAGEQLLADDVRLEMERDVVGIEGRAPDLASKALLADRHWAPRIHELQADGLGSFRGLYRFSFDSTVGSSTRPSVVSTTSPST
jgi:hypothetical protein